VGRRDLVNGVFTVHDQPPEFFQTGGFRKKAPHADDGNRYRLLVKLFVVCQFLNLFMTRKDSVGVRIARHEEPNCGEWRIGLIRTESVNV
jgi:hypothetical protein